MARSSPAAGVAWDVMECSVARSATPFRLPEPRPTGSCRSSGRVVSANADQVGGTCVQAFGAERLGQEVIRAHGHRARVLMFLSRGGEDDAGDIAQLGV